MAIVVCFIAFFAIRSFTGEEYLADTAFEPTEFRGIKWQESLDNLSDMEELYNEDGGLEIACARKGEKMSFGGAELASVEYVFVERRLSTVSVIVKGAKNKKALLAEAKSLFGHETLRSDPDYMWRFTNLMVMYSEEPDDKGVLFYKYIGFLNK